MKSARPSPDRAGSRLSTGRALLATFLLALTVLAVALDIVLWAGLRFRPPHISFIQGSAVFVAEMFYSISYAAMGWLLATRLPRNLLGWIFLALGLSMAVQLTVTFIVEQRLPGVPSARADAAFRRLGNVVAPPAPAHRAHVRASSCASPRATRCRGAGPLPAG